MPPVILLIAHFIGWPVFCFYTIAVGSIISSVITARREGLQVHSAIILPFIAVRGGGRLHLLFRPGERLLSGYTGQVLTVGDWTASSDALINQQRRLTLAKNVVVIVFGTVMAVVTAVNLTVLGLDWLRTVYWASIPAVVAGWSAATLIWNRARHGTLVVMPQAAEPEMDRMLAMLRILWASASGIRPREWESTWIDLATSIHDQSMKEMWGNLLAHVYALDSGNLDSAKCHLEAALNWTLASKTITVNHYDVLRAAAWFAARHEQDPIGARRYLRQARLPSFDVHEDARVKAGVLLAEGEFARARQAALRGLAHLSPSLDPGIARMD